MKSFHDVFILNKTSSFTYLIVIQHKMFDNFIKE